MNIIRISVTAIYSISVYFFTSLRPSRVQYLTKHARTQLHFRTRTSMRCGIHSDRSRKCQATRALSHPWKLLSYHRSLAHARRIGNATIATVAFTKTAETVRIRIQQRPNRSSVDLIYHHINWRGWEWKIPQVIENSGIRNARNSTETHVAFPIFLTLSKTNNENLHLLAYSDILVNLADASALRYHCCLHLPGHLGQNTTWWH